MNQQILQQQLKQGQQQQQANAQPFQSQQSFIPQQPNTHAQTTENSPAPAKVNILIYKLISFSSVLICRQITTMDKV